MHTPLFQICFASALAGVLGCKAQFPPSGDSAAVVAPSPALMPPDSGIAAPRDEPTLLPVVAAPALPDSAPNATPPVAALPPRPPVGTPPVGAGVPARRPRQLDSLVAAKMDAATHRILSQPDSVTAYAFDEGALDTANTALFKLKLVAQKNRLTKVEIDTALWLTGNRASFFWDDAVKRCEFWPTFGLRFQRGREVRYVLVATGCDKLRVVGADYKVMASLESDPAHAGFVAYAKGLFPQHAARFR